MVVSIQRQGVIAGSSRGSAGPRYSRCERKLPSVAHSASDDRFHSMMEGGVCDRLGCGESAACALLMAPQDTEAWLVDPDHEAALDGVGLCAAHADRISVPFGWSLSDARSPAKPKRKRRTKKVATAQPPAPDKAAMPAAKREAAEPPTQPEPRPAKPHAKAKAKAARQSRQPTVPEPMQTDAPTMQLPAVKVDHPSSPAEVPMNADRAAAGVDAESTRLSVVPGKDESGSDSHDFEDDGQGALWRGEAEHEPDETTPLLKRAFRVVRDD